MYFAWIFQYGWLINKVSKCESQWWLVFAFILFHYLCSIWATFILFLFFKTFHFPLWKEQGKRAKMWISPSSFNFALFGWMFRDHSWKQNNKKDNGHWWWWWEKGPETRNFFVVIWLCNEWKLNFSKREGKRVISFVLICLINFLSTKE